MNCQNCQNCQNDILAPLLPELPHPLGWQWLAVAVMGPALLPKAGRARPVVNPHPGARFANAPAAPLRSRRADAVETGGIIRPLGIAELERTVGERVCPNQRPDGIGG